MIQCTTTKLAEMAQRINAVHRWCVTGTPLQRGLEGEVSLTITCYVARIRYLVLLMYNSRQVRWTEEVGVAKKQRRERRQTE